SHDTQTPADRASCHSHPPPPGDISTGSLHDALPISVDAGFFGYLPTQKADELAAACAGWYREIHLRHEGADTVGVLVPLDAEDRTEEHTAELQSRENRGCRLRHEKKI